MTRHRDDVYLHHMLSHAQEALSTLGNTTKQDLAEARVLQLALLHLVEIIGEAASRVSPEKRVTLNTIPWRGMIGMRNRIIHGYDTVSVSLLWDTISDDLPPLIAALHADLFRMQAD